MSWSQLELSRLLPAVSPDILEQNRFDWDQRPPHLTPPPKKRALDAAGVHLCAPAASHPIRDPDATADKTVAVMAERLAHVRQRAATLGLGLREGEGR